MSSFEDGNLLGKMQKRYNKYKTNVGKNREDRAYLVSNCLIYGHRSSRL